MKTKAIVFPTVNEIELRDVELPELGENQILTKTIYTFVSPGTELRTLQGFYGADKRYPFVPGYSSVSRIIEVGCAVKNYKVGDVISSGAGGKFSDINSVWGGQSAYHVFSGESSEHVILPDLSDEELLPYAVIEIAGISCRGVSMTDPQKGDKVLVIGQGIIGKFSAELFRIRGGYVTVADINDNRLKEAASAGFDTVDLKDENAQERLSCYSLNGFDIVSECSGSSAGVKTAYAQIKNPPRDTPLRYIQKLPKLLLQASYVNEIPINPAYFYKAESMKIITPNDRDFDDRKVVAELIRNKEFDVSPYIRNLFTPEAFIGAYRKLQNQEISSAVFKWD